MCRSYARAAGCGAGCGRLRPRVPPPAHPRLPPARSASRRSTSSRAPRTSRSSGSAPRARGRRSSRRPARSGRRASSSPTRDAAAQAADAYDGEVLVGPEGLVELIAGSGADLVLNALVGSAGLGPTVTTLGEGIDLALANKESLVVGGELVMQLAEATGARILPVDSEHSALHQLIAGEPPGHRRAARAHRVRRPVPRALAGGAGDGQRRGRAAPPDLGDGREDHDRLRHAHEQGPGGHRGPPPVRDAVRADRRRRASAVDRPFLRACSATAPRSRISGTRTCACRSPTRCTGPSASTCRCGRSTWPSSAR